MGATGDGGHFDKLADRLADEFTVITYDWRGNGRSRAPGRLADDLAARALVAEAMAARGPPVAVERFWGSMTGEAGWNRLAPALRERLRATTGTLFAVELGRTSCTCPTSGAGRGRHTGAPARRRARASVFAEMARRFGERLGVNVAVTPGGHDAYHEYPDELAAAMRPFMPTVSEP